MPLRYVRSYVPYNPPRGKSYFYTYSPTRVLRWRHQNNPFKQRQAPCILQGSARYTYSFRLHKKYVTCKVKFYFTSWYLLFPPVLPPPLLFPHIFQITFQWFERSVPWAWQKLFFFLLNVRGHVINWTRSDKFRWNVSLIEMEVLMLFSRRTKVTRCHLSLRQVTSWSCFSYLSRRKSVPWDAIID